MNENIKVNKEEIQNDLHKKDLQKCTSIKKQTKIPAWAVSFIKVLNIISEDKKEALKEVYNSSTGKSRKLIKARLNTFIEEEFDSKIDSMDSQFMGVE